MILWVDGGHPPRENMRRDEALLARAESEPDFDPVLRLFRFTPHGITLGRSQDPTRVLDLARCTDDGVPWAVRPTGGRAIFHAEEWTYSYTAPLGRGLAAGSIAASHAGISDLIVASLRGLGVPAALSPGSRAPRAEHRPGPSAPCFASTVRHEVVLGGRKLLGSAQRRTARALLQQGSLLLGAGHLALADYLALPDEERARVRRALAEAATDAGSFLGSEPPLTMWADALATLLPPGTRRVDGPRLHLDTQPATAG